MDLLEWRDAARLQRIRDAWEERKVDTHMENGRLGQQHEWSERVISPERIAREKLRALLRRRRQWRNDLIVLLAGVACMVLLWWLTRR